MLKVIGQDGKYYILECDICSKDKEMYPEIKQLKGSFHSGKIPCGCAKIPKYNEQQWLIMTDRAILSRGGEISLISLSGKPNAKCKITLINNITGNYRCTCMYDFIKNPNSDGKLDKGIKISSSKRSKESEVTPRIAPLLVQSNKQLVELYHKNYKWRLKYYCETCSSLDNNGIFDIELDRLELKGFNCKCHSKSFRRNGMDVEKEVEAALSQKGRFICFTPEYTTYNTSVVEWVCNKGHNNKQMLSNMRKVGYTCPRCVRHGYNPDKPAYLYVAEFTEKDRTYLKYGITNRKSPDDRLKQIFKKKHYSKLLTVYSDGYTILKLENTIKSNFESGVEGLDITSGFTEILNFTLKEDLIKLIYNFTIGDI